MTSKSHLDRANTGHVERQNLTMRMSMRRFARLPIAFSKKLEDHIHAIALYFVHYNFCWIHKRLRVSSAMAADLVDTFWSMDDVITKIDEPAPPAGEARPYKKRA